MKKMDTTKKTVLAVGSTMILASIIAAFITTSITTSLFPMYSGLVLVGSVLLNNETKNVKSY